MSCVLGIDGGTESLRATRVRPGRSQDRQRQTRRVSDTTFASGARAEQDPEAWWSALGLAVRRRGRRSPASASRRRRRRSAPPRRAARWSRWTRRRGRCARRSSGWTCGPATRPTRVLATGDAALARQRRRPWPGLGRMDDPEGAVAGPPRAGRPSGPRTRSASTRTSSNLAADRAACRQPEQRVDPLALPQRRGGWPDSLLRGARALGRAAREMAGRGAGARGSDRHADARAADPSGPAETVQVVQGGADALIGMIGLAWPGRAARAHHRLVAPAVRGGRGPAAFTCPGLWGSYADAVYPGRTILEGGQTSTGSIIAWLRRLSRRHARPRRAQPGGRREARAGRRTGCWCSTISRATARPTPIRCRAAPSPGCRCITRHAAPVPRHAGGDRLRHARHPRPHGRGGLRRGRDHRRRRRDPLAAVAADPRRHLRPAGAWCRRSPRRRRSARPCWRPTAPGTSAASTTASPRWSAPGAKRSSRSRRTSPATTGSTDATPRLYPP